MAEGADVSQAVEALRIGNELRLDRAAVGREIGRMSSYTGRAQVAEIVECPSELWQGAKLDYVLRLPARCSNGFSARVRSMAASGPLPISPDRRLRDLTDRERGEVARLLRGGW